MENLNDKVWYRFLKVVFIIAFLIIQITGVSSVLESGFFKSNYIQCDNGKELNRYDYPKDVSDEVVINTSKICDENYVPETKKLNLSSGNTFSYTIGNYKMKTRDTVEGLLFSGGIVFLGISIFFWLISRLFFYIFIKEKFFSGRLVNTIKGIFIKK